MAKVVLGRLVVPPHPNLMIVMLDMLIGWQVGVLERKPIAAKTGAKAAHPQPEVVPEEFS